MALGFGFGRGKEAREREARERDRDTRGYEPLAIHALPDTSLYGWERKRTAPELASPDPARPRIVIFEAVSGVRSKLVTNVTVISLYER